MAVAAEETGPGIGFLWDSELKDAFLNSSPTLEIKYPRQAPWDVGNRYFSVERAARLQRPATGERAADPGMRPACAPQIQGPHC